MWLISTKKDLACIEIVVLRDKTFSSFDSVWTLDLSDIRLERCKEEKI